MILNHLGKIVLQVWNELPTQPPAPTDQSTLIDQPISTDQPDQRSTLLQKRHGLPEIVRALKSFSARSINLQLNTPGIPVWQRNYYEHIIRDQDELNAIRQYILDNPRKWDSDQDNLANTAG